VFTSVYVYVTIGAPVGFFAAGVVFAVVAAAPPPDAPTLPLLPQAATTRTHAATASGPRIDFDHPGGRRVWILMTPSSVGNIDSRPSWEVARPDRSSGTKVWSRSAETCLEDRPKTVMYRERQALDAAARENTVVN
jgi:hypothetical protein